MNVANMTSSELFTELTDTQKEDIFKMVYSDKIFSAAVSYMEENFHMDTDEMDEIANDVANEYVYNLKTDSCYIDNLWIYTYINQLFDVKKIETEAIKPRQEICTELMQEKTEETHILWSVDRKNNDGGLFYYDEPLYSKKTTEYGILSPLFKTKEEAWDYALKCANEELESLNEDKDELISYNIPDSRDYYGEGGEYLVVNMYELEGLNDTTGYTEMVSKYWVTPKIVIE